MDIKIICDEEQYVFYKDKFELIGFTVSEEAHLVFRDLNYQVQTLTVQKNGDKLRIPIADVFLIESFGRNILIHVENESFNIDKRLYQLESELTQYKFIRVNKSQILNTKKIKKMRSLINYKIKVTLKNNQIIYVTRGYYHIFKEIMEI